jgi:hypothetical protein
MVSRKSVLLSLVALLACMLGTASRASAHPARVDSEEAIAELQLAASDLVRETSNEDREGTQRAYTEFSDQYEAFRDEIEAEAPDAASRIENAFDELGDQIDAGTFDKASETAAELLEAVDDAAEAITGESGGSTTGVLATLQALESAARDLEQEASFEDARGTQRAYEAFNKLFEGSKADINAESPGAATRIEDAAAEVEEPLSSGDLDQVHDAAVRLVDAVDAEIEMVGDHAGMPDTGAGGMADKGDGVGALPLLLIAGLLLTGIGWAGRRRTARSR